MEKITALTSADIVADNIQLLKQLFPTIVKEDKIDINELKSLLGESVEEKDEYYRFTWAGKNQARLEANKPTTATLRPNKKDSKDWDTTNNIFIEGDNLEVLKLLQKSYANKIKMIYIDPPYNTGKDFVYKDNYADNLGNYLELTGQVDESGKKISTNTESDGRYHSNWLNMMYPRLRLARNLMTDDGVIFISIDDNEVHNLRKLCDEVFGEDNFISQIIWKSKYGAGAKTKGFIDVHEYILCYSKIPLINIEAPLDEEVKKAYNKKDDKFDTRGGYFTQPLMTTSMDDRPNLQYSIFHNGFEIKPDKQWVWSKERLEKAIENDEVVFNQKNDGGYSVRAKQYLKNENGVFRLGKPISVMNGPFTQEATANITELFNSNVFGFTKPVNLLKYFFSFNINECFNENEIILDFFAGSGTTAHAVMQLNAEDGGNRKCISVQLPEPTDEKSEAFKAGYNTIAEITKERIRRAGEKIKQDFKDKEGIEKLDVGFKAFKLDSSNIRAWDGNPDHLVEQLDAFANNIKTDRTEEDILFEILLKYGLDLTVAIEEKTLAQQKVFSVGLGTLFICLSNTITPEVSEGIGTWKQELNPTRCRVIFKDTGFASDKDKVNSMQILKRFGVEDVNSI